MLKKHLHKEGRKGLNPNSYFQYFKCNLDSQLSQEDNLSFPFLPPPPSGDCLLKVTMFLVFDPASHLPLCAATHKRSLQQLFSNAF